VTRTIRLPDDVILSNATFLQDIPASGLLRVFLKQEGRNVTLNNVRINRGTNPKLAMVPGTAS
jgi:hypothetical protein